MALEAITMSSPRSAATTERPRPWRTATMGLLLGLLLAGASPATGDSPLVVYYFWGDGCPHCEVEKAFLAEMIEAHPELRIVDYEVWYDEDNRRHLAQMADAFGIRPFGTPITFIGDSVWIGFSDQAEAQMRSKIEDCLATGCADAATAPPGRAAASVREERYSAVDLEPVKKTPTPDTLVVPFIGEVDLAAHSLVFTTAVIALVDGFNPCSLWVLSMLLAIVINTRSRLRIALVGVTFLSVTAAAYGVFIAGVFNALSYIRYLGWIQVSVALLALSFALINIKDYFWFKKGVSLTIAEHHKPGIFRRMRGIVTPGQKLPGMLGATAAMALGITLVELPCTAGFPLIWGNILAARDVGGLSFALLLALYLLIYLLDELAVLATVTLTLKASRLEEHHGRVLKLVGGMIMLALAGVLLLAPEIMDSVNGSLLVFAGALGASALMILVHRLVVGHPAEESPAHGSKRH